MDWRLPGITPSFGLLPYDTMIPVPHILIIVAMATTPPLTGQQAPSHRQWPVIQMERFESLKACTAAATDVMSAVEQMWSDNARHTPPKAFCRPVR